MDGVRYSYSCCQLAAILFVVIAKFIHVKEIERQQLISNKGSEFCCRFTHVRKDILLTENTNTYTVASIKKEDARLSKSLDIKGALTLSVTIVSFLVTLQLLEKSGPIKQFNTNYLVFKSYRLSL